jgi:hypothetical protein
VIVEFYGLKCLFLGFFFGYFTKKLIYDFNKTKFYEIRDYSFAKKPMAKAIQKNRRSYEEKKAR